MLKKKAELMAPAGSFESLRAAIDAGADSVYFGVTQLNMRARSAANFDLDDMAKICEIASEHNVKTYLTVNTLLYEHDLQLVQQLIKNAKDHGVSAVICADMAAISFANSINQPVHISTQLSISNLDAVKFYSRFAETIVLARELDLPMIESICEGIKRESIIGSTGKLVEIELFVHGALCIAQSGRCTMSLFQENSSANRGACKQTCRHAYKLTNLETGQELKVENNYILSPTDLCCIDFLDRILEVGVSVLKIEGRGRSADYVYKVIRAYREAIDAVYDETYSEEKIEHWFNSLKTVYNRGLSDGWYLGRPIPELSGSYGSKATEEKVYIGKVQKFFPNISVAEIVLEAHDVTSEDKGIITGPETGYMEISFESIRNAETKEITEAKRKEIITCKVPGQVHKNDKVYIVIKRNNADIS